MSELARSVGQHRRWRRRGLLAVGAASLAVGGLAGFASIWHRPTTVTTVVVEHTPPPVIVTVEVPVPAQPEPEPEPVPAGPAKIACPVFDASADQPVGIQVRPKKEYEDAQLKVAASAATPRIAILADGAVLVSDDDGARFAPAFKGHDVREIAVAHDGTLYAVEDDRLGVRTFPGGTETWRNVPGAVCKDSGECPWCDNRIAVVEDRLVWFHNAELSVTTDRGRHWKNISTERMAWSGSTNDGVLLPFRGALYEVHHYQDRCGVDDTPVWRLNGNGRIDHTIFHNYYESQEPVLEGDDEVGIEWQWRERCWGEDASVLTSCSKSVPAVSAMLRVGTLRPVEGARALAVYGGSLIELCDDGARQVYRAYPFETIDAVDAQGRPLVVRGDELLRWSAVHGWRRLYKRPAEPDREEL